MEIIKTCPFGSECEEAKNGHLYRCRLYVSMGRADENGQIIPGSEYDECALALQSIHLTELKKGTRMVQHAIESARNETSRRQDELLQIARDDHARALQNR